MYVRENRTQRVPLKDVAHLQYNIEGLCMYVEGYSIIDESRVRLFISSVRCEQK